MSEAMPKLVSLAIDSAAETAATHARRQTFVEQFGVSEEEVLEYLRRLVAIQRSGVRISQAAILRGLHRVQIMT